MLTASAYSLRQKSRLAISLSWIAGYTNVITFIAGAVVISHATGNVTHAGKALAGGFLGTPGAAREALYYAALVGSFFLGAVVSAFMTEGARRAGLRSKYILPMALQAVLLCVLAVCLHHYIALHQPWTFYAVTTLASFTMGLQNATVTKVSGAVVRTTHLTGIVTDMGIEGVQYVLWAWDKTRAARPSRRGRVAFVSRRHPSVLRFMLLASVVGSFTFGVVAGTVAWAKVPQYALIAPVAFLLWIIVMDWRRPIADVRELDVLHDPDNPGYDELRTILPAGLGVCRLFHPRRDAVHHAPDFQLWVDRLPRQWRVIILAVSPLTHFDKEEALDLLAAVQKLRAGHKDLIVCGANRAQYKVMHEAGLAHVLGVANFCPDLDMALARAMNRAPELSPSGPARRLSAEAA